MELELMFQEYEITGLERVCGHSFPGEQTIDVIIPDSYPDVERIVDAFGTLMVQEPRLLPGGVSLSGLIQGGVLFVGENGSVHSLPVKVPFSLRKELGGVIEEGTLRFHCDLTTVDARTVNSRKLLVRVGFYWGFEIYRPCGWKVGYMDEPAETLQLRQKEYPLRIPTATGEKNFTVNEEFELPDSCVPIASVLKTCIRTRITEQKAVGGKGVFKTEFLLHLLYEDPKGTLCTYEWRIPVAQVVDLNGETQEGELHTILHVMELDAEPDSQIESRRLFLRLGIHAQCMVYEVRTVKLIEDAYCTDGILEPKWQQWQCRPLLDSVHLQGTTQWNGDESVDTAVDLWQWTEEAHQDRKGEDLILRIPVTVSMLYYDKEGALRGKLIRSMVETEFPVHEGCECVLRDVECTEAYCNITAGRQELRIPIRLTADTFGTEQHRTLMGGEVRPLPTSEERKPSVILRRTEGEEELWDIGKHYGTSVKGIREANALTEDTIPNGTMLLIPLEA